MPQPRSTSLCMPSPAATADLARRIAPHLRPGDAILLEGEIGAGKTHFARALIQSRLAARGKAEDVPSPTYTLVQTYDDGLLELWHADLYRLSGCAEIDELGLTEALEDAVCLIEWPDRLGDAAPPDALVIAFGYGAAPEERMLTLSSENPRWNFLFDDIVAPPAHG